jgi:hypothetical protein
MSTARQQRVLVEGLKVQASECDGSVKGFRTRKASSRASWHTNRISGGGQDDEAGLWALGLEM